MKKLLTNLALTAILNALPLTAVPGNYVKYQNSPHTVETVQPFAELTASPGLEVGLQGGRLRDGNGRIAAAAGGQRLCPRRIGQAHCGVGPGIAGLRQSGIGGRQLCLGGTGETRSRALRQRRLVCCPLGNSTGDWLDIEADSRGFAAERSSLLRQFGRAGCSRLIGINCDAGRHRQRFCRGRPHFRLALRQG